MGIGLAGVIAVSAQNPRAVLDRAVGDFAAGRLDEAAAGFDEVAVLVPRAMPQL